MGLNYLQYLHLLYAQTTVGAEREMTAGSWLYMLAVWGVIIALNIFCFRRIFSK